jgi:hypothetical protein
MQVCLDPENLTVGELRGSGDFHQPRYLMEGQIRTSMRTQVPASRLPPPSNLSRDIATFV